MRVKNRVICLCVILLGLFMLPVNSWADLYDYIQPGATYSYTFDNQGEGWQNLSFNDSNWSVGKAPFSNVLGGDFGYNTYWPAGTDPYLRIAFNLGQPVDMKAYLGLDNGFDMWVNGSYITGRNAEGFTDRWEYVFDIADTYFKAGENVIALRLEDHGGATAFDMKLTGDAKGLETPEPASMLLLGSGLLGVFGLGYKKKEN